MEVPEIIDAIRKLANEDPGIFKPVAFAKSVEVEMQEEKFAVTLERALKVLLIIFLRESFFTVALIL